MIVYTEKSLAFAKEVDFNTFKTLHKELNSIEATLTRSTTDLYLQLEKDGNLFHVSLYTNYSKTYINSIEELIEEGEEECTV